MEISCQPPVASCQSYDSACFETDASRPFRIRPTGGWQLLLAVCRGRRIRLVHGDVLYPHAAVGHALQARVRLVIKVLGQVLCRRVDYGERLNVVDHLMIQAFDDVLHDLAEVLKIEEQTGLIQLGAGQRHADLVIVPVRILTLAFVVAQVMARRKRIVDRDFKHAFLSGSGGYGPDRVQWRNTLLYRATGAIPGRAILAESCGTITTATTRFAPAVLRPRLREHSGAVRTGPDERPVVVDAGFLRTHATSRHPHAEWRSHIACGECRSASPRGRG